MNYEGILEFKGTWRNYQARVLEHADRYMADGKIHIVAAPGSGKTTLGIELIRRMNGKALILAPSITIRSIPRSPPFQSHSATWFDYFVCETLQIYPFSRKRPKKVPRARSFYPDTFDPCRTGSRRIRKTDRLFHCYWFPAFVPGTQGT